MLPYFGKFWATGVRLKGGHMNNHYTLLFSTPKHRVRANKSCKELFEKYRALFYMGGATHAENNKRHE